MGETLSVADFVIDVYPAVSNTDNGRATKKVRRWPDLPPDTNDPTVDENGRKLLELWL
ncbi:hypothetical protein Golob_003060, partial [Gossypium lobatum]|nr:hypothetical protein [Gossypium lobatum]MBA0698351.1 hypothetical protein [Gossypium aridum]